MLEAVLTADLVNSSQQGPESWMPLLKEELRQIGPSPQSWEIYRGDSLQALCPVLSALHIALSLKAALRQQRGLDIRLALGIGTVDYRAEKVTQSNGSAFVRSGKGFDSLGKDQSLLIASPWPEFDEPLNLLLSFLHKLSSAWNPNRALLIHQLLKEPELTQQELAKRLGKQQGNISYSLSKAGYDELRELLAYYEAQIQARNQ